MPDADSDFGDAINRLACEVVTAPLTIQIRSKLNHANSRRDVSARKTEFLAKNSRCQYLHTEPWVIYRLEPTPAWRFDLDPGSLSYRFGNFLVFMNFLRTF